MIVIISMYIMKFIFIKVILIPPNYYLQLVIMFSNKLAEKFALKMQKLVQDQCITESLELNNESESNHNDEKLSQGLKLHPFTSFKDKLQQQNLINNESFNKEANNDQKGHQKVIKEHLQNYMSLEKSGKIKNFHEKSPIINGKIDNKPDIKQLAKIFLEEQKKKQLHSQENIPELEQNTPNNQTKHEKKPVKNKSKKKIKSKISTKKNGKKPQNNNNKIKTTQSEIILDSYSSEQYNEKQVSIEINKTKFPRTCEIYQSNQNSPLKKEVKGKKPIQLEVVSKNIMQSKSDCKLKSAEKINPDHEVSNKNQLLTRASQRREQNDSSKKVQFSDNKEKNKSIPKKTIKVDNKRPYKSPELIESGGQQSVNKQLINDINEDQLKYQVSAMVSEYWSEPDKGLTNLQKNQVSHLIQKFLFENFGTISNNIATIFKAKESFNKNSFYNNDYQQMPRKRINYGPDNEDRSQQKNTYPSLKQNVKKVNGQTYQQNPPMRISPPIQRIGSQIYFEKPHSIRNPLNQEKKQLPRLQVMHLIDRNTQRAQRQNRGKVSEDRLKKLLVAQALGIVRSLKVDRETEESIIKQWIEKRRKRP